MEQQALVSQFEEDYNAFLERMMVDFVKQQLADDQAGTFYCCPLAAPAPGK